jgi:hypothetical protein
MSLMPLRSCCRYPFLAIAQSAWVASYALAFAIRDGFLVTRGHTLIIIRRREVATWFEATREDGVCRVELARRSLAFGKALLEIRTQLPRTQIQWGTGKTGSATLKRNGNGLVEFYLDGKLAFRRERPRSALGEAAGQAYLNGLREIYPQMTGEINPNVPTNVPAAVAGPGLELLAGLLRKVLASAA